MFVEETDSGDGRGWKLESGRKRDKMDDALRFDLLFSDCSMSIGALAIESIHNIVLISSHSI